MKIICTIALLFVGIAHAQGVAEDDAPAADADVVPEEQPIDEIIVVAPRSIGRIKTEIIAADRKMFGLFNDMHTAREYKVYCRREKLYASNRKKRMCLPQFEHGVMDEAWQNLDSGFTSARVPEEELCRKRETLRQMMIDFAEQNPELAEAIYRRAQLERDLAEAEARRKEADE